MSLMGTTSPRCPLCGDPRHACGEPSDTVPVDQRTERSTSTMAELKRYNVTVNGHNTVMQLTAEKAAAMGGTPYTPPPPTPKPEEQAAVISGLQTELDDATAEIARLRAELEAAGTSKDSTDGAAEASATEEEAKAAPAPANKSRTPRNKGA